MFINLNRPTFVIKVERIPGIPAYIELGRWLCSHFQLESLLNFLFQADNLKSIQCRSKKHTSSDSLL